LPDSNSKKNIKQSIKQLEKQIAGLEIQLKEKDMELKEATDLLSTFQKQLKECEELKGRIDREIEKRLDKLMLKQFDGCKRCKS
jgi:flagellar biosynthesis chaperone FliJ